MNLVVLLKMIKSLIDNKTGKYSNGKEKKLFLDWGLEDGIKVVDIACGPRIITSLISDLVPNLTVLGIDINSQFISLAKE